MDPILTTLLDLDWQLGGNADLCIGGGLGLYIKQEYLRNRPDERTRFPFEALPAARTTEDIDVFLRAEVVADVNRMRQLRGALDTLGFTVVDSAEYMQFIRPMSSGIVKIDLLVGPLGEFAPRIKRST